MIVTDRSARTPSARRLGWRLPAVILVGMSGCGETNPLSGVKLYPVKGKVMLADGKPLSAGKVVFVGDKTTFTSTTTIADDGGFEFKEGSGTGLPEGDYRVRLETTAGTSKGVNGNARLPFASRYLDEDNSTLRATVVPDESKNNFEFKLDSRELASTTPARGRK
jgi:hypothetical protein